MINAVQDLVNATIQSYYESIEAGLKKNLVQLGVVFENEAQWLDFCKARITVFKAPFEDWRFYLDFVDHNCPGILIGVFQSPESLWG